MTSFDSSNWKIVAGVCAYTALAIAIVQVGGGAEGAKPKRGQGAAAGMLTPGEVSALRAARVW